MKPEVIVRNVAEATELRGFAEGRFARALERFERSVLGATMRLEDVTGPEKGGVDKSCAIEVRLRTGDIRITEQGDDFHATIDVALDRMRQALGREVSRVKRGVGKG